MQNWIFNNKLIQQQKWLLCNKKTGDSKEFLSEQRYSRTSLNWNHLLCAWQKVFTDCCILYVTLYSWHDMTWLYSFVNIFSLSLSLSLSLLFHFISACRCISVEKSSTSTSLKSIWIIIIYSSGRAQVCRDSPYSHPNSHLGRYEYVLLRLTRSYASGCILSVGVMSPLIRFLASDWPMMAIPCKLLPEVNWSECE